MNIGAWLNQAKAGAGLRMFLKAGVFLRTDCHSPDPG
jgi:hypothetical protein